MDANITMVLDDQHAKSAAFKQDIVSHFVRILGQKDEKDLDEAEASFLNQFLEDYEKEELSDLSADQIAQIMSNFYQLGDQRESQTTKEGWQTLKRISPLIDRHGKPTAYDIIEIIQNDAPFIVESLIGELIELGVSIRSMFHPVLSVARDKDGKRLKTKGVIKESMVLVIIDHQTKDRHKVILGGIDETLNDLKLAVLDFPKMLTRLDQEINSLEALLNQKPQIIDKAILTEDIDFLRWIGENHFVFLGAKIYTYPKDKAGNYAQEEPLNQLEQGLGVLRDPKRPVLRRSSEPAVLSPSMLAQIASSQPVTVAKANMKSRVHRHVYMDYIGIKHYGPDGKPSGEIRFVGLFTSEAYDRPVFEVPLIRKKAEHVLNEALRIGFNTGGYNEKRLKNIIETYPRDELFQMNADDLLRISRGIMHLSDRPRVKLFTRNDPFDRFISVLLYTPRELYQVSMQQRAGEILAEAYAGRVSACYPYITESLLSCIHYIIGVTPADHLDPSIPALETSIENVTRAWPQKVEAAVRDIELGQATPAPCENLDWLAWAQAFPMGYQERYSIAEAVIDIAYLASLTNEKAINLQAYAHNDEPDKSFCFKLYNRAEKVIPLSDVLPILDNMGLKTVEEYGFSIKSWALGNYWVHEFIIELPQGHRFAFNEFKSAFEQTVLAIWQGKTQSDGFNALTLSGQSYRDVALIRALSRYRLQSGLDPSPQTQQDALREHDEVVTALLDLFKLKFNLNDGDIKTRAEAVSAQAAKIDALLRAVSSLEHDRVLRRLFALIMACQRTNYYQLGADGEPKPYISFKIASRELVDLPEPKPYREIYVWAPHVEGVHLRFGPVARGGLRWSDRKDDFRTEVLGLVKAQQVKNAVIVPVGSKGGFYPKNLPRGGTAEAIRAEAIHAYKTFLRGLLDLTDNLDANAKIVHPKNTIMWDEPDPYLVVAADKGTATFSDIANSVSNEYGFWLGDAFASGGSVGYDHKVMGITARGAWEAIKRHFREMDKDIQTEAFSVAGVGDMSGDVFGNGMLLSPKIKLIAAFDHRDIFLDPDPDMSASLKERARLFALPRSSWNDYDAKLISKGGGVFSRSLKSIPISEQVGALLDIDAKELSPNDLMQVILKSRVELLYFGGIGTYIKSGSQSHLEVGDKANDGVRIDAGEVRALVIGEGANLGLTQAGRIGCAMNGVRLNTDAIDNSAGVDCSDHEVNIKILLGALMATKTLDMAGRDKLLATMTHDVARHVLAHNYAQTLALSLQERTAAQDNLSAQNFMVSLESRGKLDRKVEGLPSNTQLLERRSNAKGLVRPELAVIMAYAKLVLFDDLVASSAPDDQAFDLTLLNYFPTALSAHKEAIHAHRLQREIISTILANDIVNMAGPSFATRLQKSANLDVNTMALSFEGARRLFNLNELWAKIGALDNKIPDAAQKALYARVATFLRRQAFWLGRHMGSNVKSLDDIIKPYQAGITTLLAQAKDLISPSQLAQFQATTRELILLGANEDIANQVAILDYLMPATHIIDIGAKQSASVENVARLYYLIGERFVLDHLRTCALQQQNNTAMAHDEWDKMATRRLIEDLFSEQKSLTGHIIDQGHSSPKDALDKWCAANSALIAPWDTMIKQIEASSGSAAGAVWSFAKLTIVNANLREWVGKI